jgi:predicted transcriptional regulator
LSQARQSSIEHVRVESCDDLIAKENDKLKQEVEKLQKDLYVLKEKNKVHPSQDNCEDMVKKLEKGSTITSSTLNNIQ